ncbi:hypothetical protein [Methylorubrum zatmanii]|uniref:Chemotaxis protein n=1 Tax=Methylorubrum zatmanii TaxID=29429 RepID=A0ABW1WL04_9HYPH|nr:hypothetical protein [Methylorubrum zatmanii]MBD8906526.1 hypothetical protein [Methylorubrum zatmanii]
MTSIDIANLLHEHGLQGALAVAGVVIGFLFMEVRKATERYLGLLERVVAVIEANKAAASDSAEALKDNERAVASLSMAIQTLARETEGEAREVRHGIAGLQTSANAVAEAIKDLIRGRA